MTTTSCSSSSWREDFIEDDELLRTLSLRTDDFTDGDELLRSSGSSNVSGDNCSTVGGEGSSDTEMYLSVYKYFVRG